MTEDARWTWETQPVATKVALIERLKCCVQFTGASSIKGHFGIAAIMITLLAASNATAGLLSGRLGFNLGGLDSDTIGDAAFAGAKLGRIQIHLSENDPLEAWLPRVDQAVDQLLLRGMTAVIDLHTHDTVTQVTKAERTKTLVDIPAFADIWRRISTRYAAQGSKNQVWYDLWKEPPAGDRTRQALHAAAEAIRQQDDSHPIVVPAYGDRAFGVDHWRPLPGIGNQILGVHLWDFHRLTHNFPPTVFETLSADQKSNLSTEELADAMSRRVEWSENDFIRCPNANSDKSDMRSLLGEVAAASHRFEVPVSVGEVGIYGRHPDASQYLGDVLSLIERRHPTFNVALHAWREASVWNYEGTEAWPAIQGFLNRSRFPISRQVDSAPAVPEPSALVLALIGTGTGVWLVGRGVLSRRDPSQPQYGRELPGRDGNSRFPLRI